MRLCLSIEIQEGLAFADTLAMTRAGESLGFEAALLAEHYYPSGKAELYADGPGAVATGDAWMFLAGMARETERIRLGTLVSPVTFRHPVVLAKLATTLDHMSGGRAELGIGAGWLESEHAAYGFDFPPPPRRVDLVKEQLQVISGLWSPGRETFSHSGPAYHLDNAHFSPKPVQQPRPTLIVGGSSNAERLPKLAARYADEYVINSPSLEQCRQVRATLDRACETIGRDPGTVRLSAFLAMCVAPEERQIPGILDTYATTNPQYARMLSTRDNWIIGTPEQAQAQLEALSAAGIDRALLSVNCDLHREMLPLLAQDGMLAYHQANDGQAAR